MATLLNRGLSLLVAAGYIALGALFGGAWAAWRVLLALLFPLVCIWFPDALGRYKGTIRLQAITDPTPAAFVCAGGWFLLVGLPLILYFVVRANQ
jgi:hypothetical protein